MKKRLKLLVIGGSLVVAGAFLSLRYLDSVSRPQTDAEWNADRHAQATAKWTADLRKDVEAGIAVARTPRERRLAEYDLRLLNLTGKVQDIDSLVMLSDGIDEFEALLIARAYFGFEFGACGSVELPERTAEGWSAAIFAGREAKPEPPITIDGRSGEVRCAGHPTISDMRSLLEGKPNKAPEPTPGLVTPRALD